MVLRVKCALTWGGLPRSASLVGEPAIRARRRATVTRVRFVVAARYRVSAAQLCDVLPEAVTRVADAGIRGGVGRHRERSGREDGQTQPCRCRRASSGDRNPPNAPVTLRLSAPCYGGTSSVSISSRGVEMRRVSGRMVRELGVMAYRPLIRR